MEALQLNSILTSLEALDELLRPARFSPSDRLSDWAITGS